MEENNKFYKNQSKQFDKAAEYYDRFRPSYPNELIKCIIDKTGIKEDSKILEIGAGSGKATELFVNKGFDMYCIEPGANLVEVGKKKFSYTDKVNYHTGRFEEIRSSKCFKDPIIYRFPWSQSYTTEEYIGFMKT